MISDTVSPEEREQIMAAIREAVEKEVSLTSSFRRVMLKVHPDKKETAAEKAAITPVFQGVDAVFKSILPLFSSQKLSQEQKVDLATTLKQLPDDLRDSFIAKIKKDLPQFSNVDLINPKTYAVKNTYEFQASNPLEGRNHGFAVIASNFKNLKAQYEGSKGDHLKTQILADFKTRIENTSSKEELAALKKEINASEESRVINTGQGLFTKLTGIKTSSAKALDAMFEQQEQNLSGQENDNKM